MKEKEVIDKLRLLRSVQPDEAALRLIRNKIPSQVAASKGFSIREWFSRTPLIPLVAIAVIIFLFIVIILFSNIFNNALVVTKIALAPNHYEKAKIALSNVYNTFYSLKQDTSNTQKLVLLSDSLTLANTEMSGLQLVGEKGIYTSYQCEELYESYHKDLVQIENSLHTNRTNSAMRLVSLAKQYDLQAQEKLKGYSQKKWTVNKNQE